MRQDYQKLYFIECATKQMEIVQRVSFMVWEIMGAEEEQMFITGMLLLCDLDGYTMNHFTQMPISTMKKLMPCWEV